MTPSQLDDYYFGPQSVMYVEKKRTKYFFLPKLMFMFFLQTGILEHLLMKVGMQQNLYFFLYITIGCYSNCIL